MTQDGENPEEYVFETGTASPKKRASISLQGNGNVEDGDDENAANENVDTTEKTDSAEVVIDIVVENPKTSETTDPDKDQIQLTMADSDKLDNNTLDNEDSLNLTIGEDEAKIFQDEVNPRSTHSK